jgi:hypothetical protein
VNLSPALDLQFAAGRRGASRGELHTANTRAHARSSTSRACGRQGPEGKAKVQSKICQADRSHGRGCSRTA